MPSLRCINVQGWEPSDDGADLVHVDLPAFAAISKKNTQTFMNTTTATIRSDAAWANGPRRQVPLERTSTMPYLSVPSRPTMQRHHTSEPVARPAQRMQTSSRSAAAAGRSVRPRSSTERKIARKRAENANYIPRPRNSFIIFRTEFVLRKAGAGGKHEDGDEDEAGGTLSKQASEEWHRMSDADKQPWVDRAEQEKREHAVKYPHYRYRPVRQSSRGKSTSVDRSSASVAPDIAGSTAPSQVPQDETLPKEPDVCAMPELRMPAPVNASPMSRLADALITPPTSPNAQHPSLALPNVPRVPVLNLPPRPALRYDSTLPPMPRSPSAPAFMPDQMQSMLFGGGDNDATNLHIPRGPGVRRISCPPKPRFDLFGLNEAPKATEAPLPVADVSMARSPLSAGGSDTMGVDYFPEFVHDDKDADEHHSFFAQDLAGPDAHMSWQDVTEFMTKNDDYYTRFDTNLDVNMSALLPPVIEEAEPPFSLPSGATTLAQQPLEAVAALWSRNLGGASDFMAPCEFSAGASETAAGNDRPSPMTNTFSDGGEHLNDFDLGTYNCALNDFLASAPAPVPATDSAARQARCSMTPTDFDVLQLGRDLESELSYASVLPASTLSFSALCGF